jgi:hypothetical protein
MYGASGGRLVAPPLAYMTRCAALPSWVRGRILPVPYSTYDKGAWLQGSAQSGSTKAPEGRSQSGHGKAAALGRGAVPLRSSTCPVR